MEGKLCKPFHKETDMNYKTFLFHAIATLFDTKNGRAEFFATPEVDIIYGGFGPSWEKSREDTILSRLQFFAKFLATVPVDIVQYRICKLGGDVTSSMIATRAGSEFAEILLLTIGLLARDIEHTDLVSLSCADAVTDVMPCLIDEVAPCILALRCLYSFCFLSEPGQYSVRGTCKVEGLLQSYRESSIGLDTDIKRDCRRVELAIADDGWRGRVEETMTRELEERRAISRAHRVAISKGERYVPPPGTASLAGIGPLGEGSDDELLPGDVGTVSKW
jgi:hypothetical protein